MTVAFIQNFQHPATTPDTFLTSSTRDGSAHKVPRMSLVHSHPLLLCIAVAASTAVFGPATYVGAEPAASETRSTTFVIDAVIIEGLFRTKSHVVMRELLFEEGDTATLEEIEESIQRLRNLGLFRVAEYELLDRRIPLPDGTIPQAEEQHRILKIVVDERWTIIPFGTFSSGGGTFSLTTGIYDINLLGRYIELGGQYQRFADTNSFSIWASDPRFLGERMSLAVTLSQTNRVNVFYDDAGELEGGHLRLRRSFAVGMGREWVRWFSSGASVAYLDDTYSLELISDELAESEQTRGLPDRTRTLLGRLSASVGRIDSNSYLREGLRLSGAVAGASERVGSTISYVDTTATFTAFVLLPLRANFGFRTGIGATTTEQPEYQYFIGGFNILRGFLHRRFRGSHYWYANAELRVPSLDTRWVTLQHIGFVDAAAAADGLEVTRELDGASAGVGLRIISPKVYSLLARVDLAWPIYGDGGSILSFGAGQFF